MQATYWCKYVCSEIQQYSVGAYFHQLSYSSVCSYAILNVTYCVEIVFVDNVKNRRDKGPQYITQLTRPSL